MSWVHFWMTRCVLSHINLFRIISHLYINDFWCHWNPPWWFYGLQALGKLWLNIYANTCGLHRVNPPDCGDPVTLSVAPPWGWHFGLQGEYLNNWEYCHEILFRHSLTLLRMNCCNLNDPLTSFVAMISNDFGMNNIPISVRCGLCSGLISKC